MVCCIVAGKHEFLRALCAAPLCSLWLKKREFTTRFTKWGTRSSLKGGEGKEKAKRKKKKAEYPISNTECPRIKERQGKGNVGVCGDSSANRLKFFAALRLGGEIIFGTRIYICVPCD